MRFNGLKYTVTEKERDIEFGQPVPTSLLKFYANSEYSQEAVMEHYLYLTHTSQFNDAYEASEYLLDFRKLDQDTYEKWSEGKQLKKPLPFTEDKATNFATFRKLYLSIMAWIGSVSFTTRKNVCNTLMWSHYATDKGFVVDFDANKLLQNIRTEKQFDGFVFPINYVKKLRPFPLNDERYGCDWGALLYLIATKHKDWKYEDEWRLSCYPLNGRFTVPETLVTKEVPGVGRQLNYPADCAKAIILGEKFFNHTNVDGDFYRTQEKPWRFKLKRDIEFVNFIYSQFNNALFLCGACKKKDKVVRSIQQIKLVKEAKDIFTVVPIDPH